MGEPMLNPKEDIHSILDIVCPLFSESFKCEIIKQVPSTW